MSRPIEVEERVAQWYKAFDTIRRELSTEKHRETLAAMTMVEGVDQLGAYMSLARNVMANDRAASITAAMLVTTGIRPMVVDIDEQP